MVISNKYKKMYKAVLIFIMLSVMISISGCVRGGSNGGIDNSYSDERYDLIDGEITYKVIDNTFIKIEDGESTVLARNVDKLLLRPIGSTDLNNCEGVEIKILLKNGNETESIETIIYFRKKTFST